MISQYHSNYLFRDTGISVPGMRFVNISQDALRFGDICIIEINRINDGVAIKRKHRLVLRSFVSCETADLNNLKAGL